MRFRAICGPLVRYRGVLQSQLESVGAATGSSAISGRAGVPGAHRAPAATGDGDNVAVYSPPPLVGIEDASPSRHGGAATMESTLGRSREGSDSFWISKSIVHISVGFSKV